MASRTRDWEADGVWEGVPWDGCERRRQPLSYFGKRKLELAKRMLKTEVKIGY